MTADLSTLRRQLQDLQAQHTQGALDADTFAQRKQALEAAILAQVMAEGAAPASAAASAHPPAVPRPSRRLWLGSTVFTVLVAAAGYGWMGAPSLLSPPPAVVQGAEGEITPQQVEAMIQQLSERMASRPDDLEGWTMLARAYNAVGKPVEAVAAFRKAVALSPKDAGLLADLADALGASQGRSLAGEPAQLIAQSLALDPTHPKALWLAGTEAFNRQDHAGAARIWERILARLEPQSPVAAQVRDSINEARKLAGMPALSAPAPAAASASAAEPAPAAANARVSGRVTLSAALAAQAAPEDTVFIFARAAEGPRMPLAIVRKQVKDLPLTFSLDDSMAMAPEMRLSNFAQVVVGARISKKGDAMPQPGDLQGQSAPVAVGTSDLNIEINQTVAP